VGSGPVHNVVVIGKGPKIELMVQLGENGSQIGNANVVSDGKKFQRPNFSQKIFASSADNRPFMKFGEG
jgi:hypothetical protein